MEFSLKTDCYYQIAMEINDVIFGAVYLQTRKLTKVLLEKKL